MSAFHVYTVRWDANRHTCIHVAAERIYSYYIPMEASEVAVRRLENKEFEYTYTVIPDYPVRRAAEIYLAAPDKEVHPKARSHLEAILADPAYAYDPAQYSTPHVFKEKEMAKAAAAVAEGVAPKATKASKKSEALAAAAEVIKSAQAPIVGKAPKAAPAPKVAKEKVAAEPKPRGRAPTVELSARLKVGNIESVKRGYMLAFVTKAQELEKLSRGKGFTGEALIEAMTDAPETEGRGAPYVKTYLSYSLAAKRGILVPA